MKQNKTKIIGLTGTIGSGKSTCSNLFSQKFNLPIIDADKLAYEVCEKGSEGLKLIEQEFGPEYILDSGEYNRELMSETVFNNPKALEKLNNLLHPLIKQKKEETLELYKDAPVIIYDCPLLFESGEDKTVDEILVITTSQDKLKERLKNRNDYNNEEIEKRIKAQESEESKLNKADTVIYNNGSINDLELVLENYLNQFILKKL